MTIRAFIAVEVDAFPGILDFVDELKKSPTRLKAVEPKNMHITLRFLGDIDDDKAEELSKSLRSLESEAVFSFEVSSAGAFPNMKNPKVIWAGIEEGGELSAIRRKVEDICEASGLERDKREFSPHLTLARVKDRKTKGIRPIIERYRGTYFGTVRVTEVKLKKSVLTPEGPVYSDIASIGLKG